MSGGPAYSVGNQKKFSSWFSPAFFKSGPGGVGGWPPPTIAPNEVKGEPPLELFQAEAEAVQRLLPAQEERDLNGAAGGHLFAGQGDAHGP